jgi:hypothetical protein
METSFGNPPMQTIVCICHHRLMPNHEPLSVSITLSPTQVDEVVRTASEGRAPSISTLIANSLRAPLRGGNHTSAGSSPSTAGKKPDPAAGAQEPRIGGHAPSDPVDPRLSLSLLRGFSILACFGPNGEARGIVELAGELGMSPSTAHRYAVTLVELGLLERCPTTRKYRLPGM